VIAVHNLHKLILFCHCLNLSHLPVGGLHFSSLLVQNFLPVYHRAIRLYTTSCEAFPKDLFRSDLQIYADYSGHSCRVNRIYIYMQADRHSASGRSGVIVPRPKIVHVALYVLFFPRKRLLGQRIPFFFVGAALQAEWIVIVSFHNNARLVDHRPRAAQIILHAEMFRMLRRNVSLVCSMTMGTMKKNSLPSPAGGLLFVLAKRTKSPWPQ
jgi:hypothetical protein